MKKLFYSAAVITALLMSSCTPDTPVNTGTSSPFTLKYEIITSSPIFAFAGNTYPTISYANGTQQNETDNSFTSGTTWTKEVIVTTPNRPFYATCTAITGALPSIVITNPGTVTSNIYINGVQVAHVVNPTTSSSLGNYANVGMSYLVN